MGRSIPSRPSAALLRPEALEEAFPNLKPSQRLALVEKAVAVQAASERRRRRLAKAGRRRVSPWAIILLAGLLCAAVGVWNVFASHQALTRLEQLAQRGTLAGQPHPAGPVAAARLGLLTVASVRDAVHYVAGPARQGPPPPTIPAEEPDRAFAIREHRQRYEAYFTLGAALAALGGAASAGSLCVLAFGRR